MTRCIAWICVTIPLLFGAWEAQALSEDVKSQAQNLAENPDSAQYYLGPRLMDGQCRVISRPSNKEAPLAFATRHQTFWNNATFDVDCIRRYYKPQALVELADKGDMIAFFVDGVTSRNFITHPCTSGFRENLESRIEPFIANAQGTRAIYFYWDFYYTAARIEQKCGNNEKYRQYYRLAADKPFSYYSMTYALWPYADLPKHN